MILVTGATGAIGPRVIEALNSLKYTVRTLSLDKPLQNIFFDKIDVRIGDITNPVDVQSAMQGIDLVIHMAALLHIVNPPVTLRERYKRINVDGTASVMEAAMKANVRRVVFFSTINVYGNTNGQIVNESSLTQPNTLYAQTKLEAERIVLSVKNADGEPMGAVLRLAAVYGSRIKGNYRQLLKALANGKFAPIGPGKNRRTLIYDKDVANAAVLALQHQDAAGKIFNVSDGYFHTLNEIIMTMCQALGRKPPKFSLPIGPVRFAVGVVEGVSRLVGFQSPIGRATINKYTEDVAVAGELIQKELGFMPKYDLANGWIDAIQEMSMSGEL